MFRRFRISPPPVAAAGALLVAFLLGALSAGVVRDGLVSTLHADVFQKFQRYGETLTKPTISANAFTIDLSKGTHYQVTLNANVTSITFSNAYANSNYAQNFTIVLTQDGTGSRTVAGWPAAVKWVGGVAPTITATASKSDIVSCLTYDGGTTDWCVYNQLF